MSFSSATLARGYRAEPVAADRLSFEVELGLNRKRGSRVFPSRESVEDEMPFKSRGHLPRTPLGENDPNCSTQADIIFISEWARHYSAKEGARLSGMTPKGFQKLQTGENAISCKRLTQWMRSDPDFAAAHAAHVGLILPGQAESASAFTKAVNAYFRGKHT